MKKGKDSRKLVVCAIIFILMSVSVAPSIYAEVNNHQEHTISDDNTFDYDRYNPVQLVFLLIHKLQDYHNLQEIEEDEELNSIIEELMSYSCGCEEGSSLEWNFPVICFLLCIPYAFCLLLDKLIHNFWQTDIQLIGIRILYIAKSLNCSWA